MSNLSGIFGDDKNKNNPNINSSSSVKPDTGLFSGGKSNLEKYTKSLNENTNIEVSEKDNEK